MNTEKKVENLVSKFNFFSIRAKEIAESLLARAVEQGREEQMMEKISDHFNRAHDMPEGHEKGLAFARAMDEYCGGSQVLRKKSIRDDRIYEDNSLTEANKPTLH